MNKWKLKRLYRKMACYNGVLEVTASRWTGCEGDRPPWYVLFIEMWYSRKLALVTHLIEEIDNPLVEKAYNTICGKGLR